MDNDDILALWNRYDEKLDRIEKLNRQIVYRMISKKTGFKLSIIKFQGIYTVLLAPVIFMMVIMPFVKNVPSTPWTMTGLGLTVLMLLHGAYFGARMFDLGRKIKVNTDPLLVTKRKLLALRQFFVNGYKLGYVNFYVGSAGILMLIWPLLKPMNNIKIVIFYAVFFTFVPLYSMFVKRLYMRKLYDRMAQELEELQEYETA